MGSLDKENPGSLGNLKKSIQIKKMLLKPAETSQV
jgi:hypothetical protein